MNREDYCSYELSKKLSEKGFDLDVEYYYDELLDNSLEDSYPRNHNKLDHRVSAPYLWEAQKWLREKKGYHIECWPTSDSKGCWIRCMIYCVFNAEYDEPDLNWADRVMLGEDTFKYVDTYEEGIVDGITRILELI